MAFVGEKIYNDPKERSFVPIDATIQKGCRVAGAVLRAAEDPEQQDFLNGIITPALLGSAWQDAFIEDTSDFPNNLMYRVVDLPRLDLAGEAEGVALKTWLAGLVHVEAAANHQPFSSNQIIIDRNVISIARTRRAFKAMTSASLWLGAIDTARKVEAGLIADSGVIQEAVRETGYKMTERTIKLARKIGSLPTLGQLTDTYSDLTVELMRSGPKDLKDAYKESIESTQQAA